MEAAEAVIRAGMLKLGAGMLGELLSADRGYRGPGCRAERSMRRIRRLPDKTIHTVLGPVTLEPGLVPLQNCKHGFAPRDAERRGGRTSCPRA